MPSPVSGKWTLLSKTAFTSPFETGTSVSGREHRRRQNSNGVEVAKASFNTSDLMGRGFDAKQAGQTQFDLRPRYPITGT
jgi:hypothetical protein